jgi:hypothetical protein
MAWVFLRDGAVRNRVWLRLGLGMPRSSMGSAAVSRVPEGRDGWEARFPADDGRSVLVREHDRQHAGGNGGIGRIG